MHVLHVPALEPLVGDPCKVLVGASEERLAVDLDVLEEANGGALIVHLSQSRLGEFEQRRADLKQYALAVEEEAVEHS